MDKEKAFKILNVDPDSSYLQTKQAYRRLAKLYHPDLAPGSEDLYGDDLLIKMQEINLAFSYLGPLLLENEKNKETENLNTEPEKPQGQEAAEEKSAKNNKPSQKKETQHPFSFFTWAGEFFKTDRKTGTDKGGAKKIRKKRTEFPGRKANKVAFDDVFNRVNGFLLKKKGQAKRVKKRNRNRSLMEQNPYQRYQNYMQLKKRMKSVRSRTKDSLKIQRVEKITPVPPVNPVGE